MANRYILRIVEAYLITLGGIMLMRAEVFLENLKRLAQMPELIFSLGFIGLILGLALALAPLMWLWRGLGLLMIVKSLACLSFPQEFCFWIKHVVTLQLIYGMGLVYFVMGLSLCWFFKSSKGSLE